MGRDLLDIVFPIECVGCGNSGRLICSSCSDDLPVLKPPYCQVCSTPGDFARCQPCSESDRWFDGIRSPYRYTGSIRQAILALKYGGLKAGSAQLADLLADYMRHNPIPGQTVMPVPMHRDRQRERGYNQADLLASRVARACSLPYAPNALVRTHRTEPQAGIADANLRAANVVGAVSVGDGIDVAGMDIIIVDDVATTGSTLEECAATLKRAGARSVWCLTLARVSGNAPSE